MVSQEEGNKRAFTESFFCLWKCSYQVNQNLASSIFFFFTLKNYSIVLWTGKEIYHLKLLDLEG